MPEILLCGAEGEQFLFENDLNTSGTDDKRRGAVELTAGQQMFRQFGNTYDDFWVHFRMAPVDIQSGTSSPSSGTTMEISSGNTVLVRLFSLAPPAFEHRIHADLRCSVRTAVAGGLDTIGPVIPHAAFEFINYDIRVRVTTVTNPDDTLTVDFYRNEVLRRSVSYTDAAGFPRPDSVTFNSRTLDTEGDAIWYQDIIITDSLPTVGMELATLVPSAVGNYSEFTNNYTAIDDVGYDQSSVISTDAVNRRESWFFADPEFNLGDKVIYGVAITTVAQTDLGGVVADFEPFVRIGGVDYPASQIGANNVAPNAYVSLFQTNPSTTNPWQQAELVGLESGIRSV